MSSLIAGNAGEVTGDILGFFARCEQEEPGLARRRMWATPFYVANDPELIKAILVTHERDFMKSTGVAVLRPIFGGGLLISDGEHWQRQHKLVVPSFSKDRLRVVERVTQAALTASLAKVEAGQSTDVYRWMNDLALDVITRALFGVDTLVEREALRDVARAVHEYYMAWRRHYLPIPLAVPLPSHRRMLRAARAVHALVDAEIARLRRAGKVQAGDDMLSQLLTASDAAGGMSDAEVRDEMVNLFLAGHDTTANLLTWTWVLLSQNPAERARLHAEVDALGHAPSLADLPSLGYADCVIKEALRIYPPLYTIGRTAKRDVTVGSHTIPKGRDVVFSQWALHRSARYFDEPLAFRPERWQPPLASKIPKYAYLPFGGGRRFCIGAQFGVIEAKLILATIAQRFELELTPGADIEPEPSVTLCPRGSVPMLLRARP